MRYRLCGEFKLFSDSTIIVGTGPARKRVCGRHAMVGGTSEELEEDD